MFRNSKKLDSEWHLAVARAGHDVGHRGAGCGRLREIESAVGEVYTGLHTVSGSVPSTFASFLLNAAECLLHYLIPLVPVLEACETVDKP